jgi:hypothetical protein
MLLYPESTLQLCSSRRFCKVFKDLFRFPVSRPDNVVFRPDAHQSATSVRMTRSFRPDSHQCLEASNSSRLHPSERNGKSSGLQSSRRSQCSSTSVRTTWLYHPDAIQGLTSIRVSASRHSYGKTAATVRKMCDPVRTMCSIRQECAYQVQPSGRQPSWSGRSSFIYGNYVHQFNRPDISLQGPDTPKPYYGNYMSLKYNRPDARATPSGRSLVMKAFGAILKRRLQLTVRTLGQAVWTLGQAVWTPSSILIITFYSNIGLGRNWHPWKA